MILEAFETMNNENFDVFLGPSSSWAVGANLHSGIYSHLHENIFMNTVAVGPGTFNCLLFIEVLIGFSPKGCDQGLVQSAIRNEDLFGHSLDLWMKYVLLCSRISRIFRYRPSSWTQSLTPLIATSMVLPSSPPINKCPSVRHIQLVDLCATHSSDLSFNQSFNSTASGWDCPKPLESKRVGYLPVGFQALLICPYNTWHDIEPAVLNTPSEVEIFACLLSFQ